MRKPGGPEIRDDRIRKLLASPDEQSGGESGLRLGERLRERLLKRPGKSEKRPTHDIT